MTDGDNGWARWAVQVVASCFGIGAALGLIVGAAQEWRGHR